ncbi:MAG: hypothetical protein M1834_002436 [Cirrosporium novae-zelandiae]|nr:MAG: hypothetical protein M1834_002436 [Cirrosporium novae-zelandiae]
MSTFSNGLNVPKKKGLSLSGLQSQPKKKRNIFDDDSDSEQTPTKSSEEAVTTLGGLSPPSSSKQKASNKHKSSRNGPPSKPPTLKSKLPPTLGAPSLSSLRESNKHSKDAEALDPSIYAYDSIYESLHAPKHESNVTSTSQGPKYMKALQATAKTRELDRLRARDKLLQKERDAEADDPELQSKEKFVTGAYTKQQEELRKLEEEENKRLAEDEERSRREGGGMMGFYREVLNKNEKQHEAVMEAAEAATKAATIGESLEEAQSKEKSEAQLAEELKAKGKNVILNDDGQVVDKRQLLSGGLNIVARPKKDLPIPTASSGTNNSSYASKNSRAKQEMRERQSKMLESQLAQSAKRTAEEELEKEVELKKASKSHKSETDISSARERYLARKREREAAAKAKAEGG